MAGFWFRTSLPQQLNQTGSNGTPHWLTHAMEQACKQVILAGKGLEKHAKYHLPRLPTYLLRGT
jgi:hypothetical protein